MAFPGELSRGNDRNFHCGGPAFRTQQHRSRSENREGRLGVGDRPENSRQSPVLIGQRYAKVQLSASEKTVLAMPENRLVGLHA